MVAALAVGSGASGLWWAQADHHGLDVDVHVRAEIIEGDGDLGVLEELSFDPDQLGEETLTRRIDPPEGGRVVLRDGADDDVLVAPRADDGLTLLIDADAGPTVSLTYVLLDADLPVDLGDLNAPAEVEVSMRNVSTEVRAELEPNENVRFPADDDEDTEPAWSTIGLIVGLVALSAWAIVLWARRRPDVVSEAVDGLPSDHSPAVVGWLLRHGRVTLEDLAATVVDLTARGFVLPFRHDGVLVLGQGRPAVALVLHEQLVVDWLFGDWVRQADLAEQREAIRRNPSRWSDLWAGFVDRVEAQGRADDLVERDVASPAVLTAAAAGLGLLVAGVVGTAHGHPGWLLPVLAGALVLGGATAFARRTPEGEDLAARWEAFGAQLAAGGTDLTPHALAYAVTLGEDAVIPTGEHDPWPAQLVHDEVERHVIGWREAYLSATSVRGEPSERVRAVLSLRALRRRAPTVLADLGP